MRKYIAIVQMYGYGEMEIEANSYDEAMAIAQEECSYDDIDHFSVDCEDVFLADGEEEEE